MQFENDSPTSNSVHPFAALGLCGPQQRSLQKTEVNMIYVFVATLNLQAAESSVHVRTGDGYRVI